MSAKTILPATAAHHAELIETLALAFQDDPAFCWLLPDAAERRKRLPRMFRVFVPADMQVGIALRAAGGEGATLWRAPGKAQTGMVEYLKSALPLAHSFGAALGRAMALGNAVSQHHPKDFDYWYLHYAGVRPAHQGKGWGGAAIRAGIERANAEGKPCFLETATPANVGLYQRLGFRILSEWDAPKGGPHFWSMLRDAD
ncbi:MAG: GNAT family N-acetyltransferase [Sphingomonadales bacterium]|nr:GNAT family N-acetyltransferase [Sphingomonadales bacterium]